MVEHELQDLFLQNSTDKQIHITFDGGEITNADIPSEEFELTESICSENTLRFGSCEAAQVSFTTYGIYGSLIGKELDITMVLDGHTESPIRIGRYKVYSDKPTADRTKRNIVAYDALYEVLNADVSGWYNTILSAAESFVTLKAFRDSFFAHFGIQQEAVSLVNDNMIVRKTIEPSELSGKTVLNAILELNGAFGRINRSGNFQYIILQEIIKGLYPADDLHPADDLFPRDESGTHNISTSDYISCQYEDFTTEKITKLQIRREENDIGAISGIGDNCYIIQNNFLCYGMSASELQTVADNVYSVISGIWYRPATITAKGNPCLEPGDGVRLHSRYEIIHTYILNRTMKGIQGLRDTYTAEGEQRQAEKVNSVRQDIVELKGKTNTLERTVEETRSELKDEDAKMLSQIIQNAAQIILKVSKGEVSSELSLEDGDVRIIGNRFILVSTNCSITADGTISCNKGIFSSAIFKDGLYYRFTYNGNVYDYPLMTIESLGTLTFGRSDMHTVVPGSMCIESGKLTLYSPTADNHVATEGYVKKNYATVSHTHDYAPVSHTHPSTSIIPVLTSAGNMSSGGSVTFATGAWVRANFQQLESSDFRLKRDLHLVKGEDTEILMQFLDRLKLYRYRFKDTTEDQNQHYGVLAQEVLSAMQEIGIDTADQSIVSEYETRSYKDEGMYTGDKAYRVNYLELLKLLIPAYQSLRSEVEELRSEVVALKEVMNSEQSV